MSQIQEEAVDVCGPPFGSIAVLAVTATSQNADMSADSYVGGAIKSGRMLRLRAEGCDVYYAWATSAQTIDDTATGATAGKCGMIPAGQFVDERPPRITDTAQGTVGFATYLHYKAATGLSGKLRICQSSNDPARYI